MGVKWDQHESCKVRVREGAWPRGRGRLLLGGGGGGEEEAVDEVSGIHAV